MKFAVLFLILTTSAFAKTYIAKDGVIPAQFVSQIRAYEKSFTGKMEGRAAEVKLTIDASNKLVMEFHDGQFNDIVGLDCRSSINELKTLNTPMFNSSKITSVTFAFDRGHCPMIEGNHVSVELNVARGTKGPAITVSLLEKTRRLPGPMYCDMRGCYQQPDITVLDWLQGKFF